MKDTVVVALPQFLPDAQRIAAFLDADVREVQGRDLCRTLSHQPGGSSR